MTEKKSRRYRRPRLDAEAHARLLEEIAKFDVPPVSVQIAETMRGLREALAEPIEDTADGAENAAARPAPDPEAAPSPPVVPPGTPLVPVAASPVPATLIRSDLWSGLRRIPVDAALLDRNLVITASRTDPAHASFDVMRTRLVQALAHKGWKRVAITSPTKGCGKSFTAVNLAIALSRYGNCRTILMDMDLRHPALATYLGVSAPGSMGSVLRGKVAMAEHLRRPGENALNIGRNLALGLNDRSETFSAELFQQPQTTEVLQAMEADFAPDVILYDMPPALAHDDVMALRPQFDCVLMIVGGGITTAAEVKEVNRRLGEDKPVLGVILNMAEDNEDNTY